MAFWRQTKVYISDLSGVLITLATTVCKLAYLDPSTHIFCLEIAYGSRCRQTQQPARWPIFFIAFTCLHRIGSDRSALALCVYPADHILVHLGPEESWVGVSLHQAVDFCLHFVEAGRGRILQALLGLLSGSMINIYLPR